MKSELYKQIVQENVKLLIYELMHNIKWIMQKDSNPKLTRRPTKGWVKLMECNALETQIQSPPKSKL